MPRDKTASHGKIMAAAREEFMEYGFGQASMRRICERCSMTAAGIYRHCRDKADLFDQLVAPAIERLNAGWTPMSTGSISDDWMVFSGDIYISSFSLLSFSNDKIPEMINLLSRLFERVKELRGAEIEFEFFALPDGVYDTDVAYCILTYDGERVLRHFFLR